MTAPTCVRVRIDGRACEVPRGTNLAALLLTQGLACRPSMSGPARGPWCGMGVCGECRVTVDAGRSVLACLVRCEDGLCVQTAGAR